MAEELPLHSHDHHEHEHVHGPGCGHDHDGPDCSHDHAHSHSHNKPADDMPARNNKPADDMPARMRAALVRKQAAAAAEGLVSPYTVVRETRLLLHKVGAAGPLPVTVLSGFLGAGKAAPEPHAPTTTACADPRDSSSRLTRRALQARAHAFVAAVDRSR